MRVKVPGLLLIIGGLMLLVGSFGGVLGLATGLAGPSTSWTTPGSEELRLDPGRWVIYQRTTDGDVQSQIPLRRISVFGPRGGPDEPASLALECLSCGSTVEILTIGTTQYLAVAGFDVLVAGSYQVTVTEPNQTVLMTASPARGLLTFAGGLLLAAAGAVVCFVALVWLVIGAVTAGRSNRPSPA